MMKSLVLKLLQEKKKRTVDYYKRLLNNKIVPYFRINFFKDLFTATNEYDDDEERFELDLSKMRSPHIRALLAHFSIKRDEEGNDSTAVSIIFNCEQSQFCFTAFLQGPSNRDGKAL